MNRNLKLLWLGNTTSIIGTSIYTMALPLLSIHLSHNIFGAGIVMFFTMIPYLFLGLIGGVVVDRVNRKQLILACDIARAILVLTIPISEALGWLSVKYLTVVGFLMTCLRTFSFPAVQSSVPLLISDRSKLNKVNSYISFTDNLAMVLGPSLGGILLIFNFNPAQLLYINAGTYLVSSFCIFLICYPKTNTKSQETSPSILSDAIGGIKFITKDNKEIAVLLAAFIAQLLVGTGIVQLGVPKLLNSIGTINGDKNFGFFLSLISLTAAITSVLYAQIKIQKPVQWVFFGYALRGVAFFLLAISKTLWMVLVIAILIGISYAISAITFTTVLQLKSPENMLGKVLAVRSTLGNLSDALSYLIVGKLLSIASLSLSFTLLAFYSLGSTLVCIWCWWYITHTRKLYVNTNISS